MIKKLIRNISGPGFFIVLFLYLTLNVQAAWQQAADGIWYYYDLAGRVQTGWVEDNGRWYFLKNTGAMAVNEWIGSYYVGYDGAWLPDGNEENDRITLDITNFEVEERLDINQDGLQERLSLLKTYNGIELWITFLDRNEPMVIPFDGVYRPSCEVTACDIGTGFLSLFIQTPTKGDDEAYWAKCFVNTGNSYHEIQVPDYRFNGLMLEDGLFRASCDSTSYSVQAEAAAVDEEDIGLLVYSEEPTGYEFIYDQSAGIYLVEITQVLYVDNLDKDQLGMVKTLLRYDGNTWAAISQELSEG